MFSGVEKGCIWNKSGKADLMIAPSNNWYSLFVVNWSTKVEVSETCRVISVA